MQFEVEIGGQLKQVTVLRKDERFVVTMEGREWVVDAAAIGGNLMSLLMAGASREISVATDPVTGRLLLGIGGVPVAVGLNNGRRRFGRKDDSHGSSGPQRIVAPMPGKVVRVLGRAGDAVARRQPVVVIEAMKMENELRATSDGTLTDVLVQPGQSVEAGMLLAIITPS